MVGDLHQNYLYIFAVDLFFFSFFIWGFIYLNISIVVVFLCTGYGVDIYYLWVLILLCVVFLISHWSTVVYFYFLRLLKMVNRFCDPKDSVLMCQTRCTVSLSILHAFVLWFINIKGVQEVVQCFGKFYSTSLVERNIYSLPPVNMATLLTGIWVPNREKAWSELFKTEKSMEGCTIDINVVFQLPVLVLVFPLRLLQLWKCKHQIDFH